MARSRVGRVGVARLAWDPKCAPIALMSAAPTFACELYEAGSGHSLGASPLRTSEAPRRVKINNKLRRFALEPLYAAGAERIRTMARGESDGCLLSLAGRSMGTRRQVLLATANASPSIWVEFGAVRGRPPPPSAAAGASEQESRTAEMPCRGHARMARSGRPCAFGLKRLTPRFG